jgi:hypothetical protein
MPSATGRTAASWPRLAIAGSAAAAILSVVMSTASIVAAAGANAGGFPSDSAENAALVAFIARSAVMAALALALVGFLPNRQAARGRQRSWFIAGIVGCGIAALTPLGGFGPTTLGVASAGLLVLAVIGWRTGVWDRSVAVAMGLLPAAWILESITSGKLSGLPVAVLLTIVAVVTARAQRR